MAFSNSSKTACGNSSALAGNMSVSYASTRTATTASKLFKKDLTTLNHWYSNAIECRHQKIIQKHNNQQHNQG